MSSARAIASSDPFPHPEGKPRGSRGFVVPMVLGPLRGYWWDLASGGKMTRLLLGTYERDQTALFRQLVQPGQQVLDVGAATGYYTLLAAKCVGPTGSVIACEPDPDNLRYLRDHVRKNRLEQVQILPLAVGDAEATASFGGGTGTGTKRLCTEGTTQVPVKPLDQLTGEHGLHPQHVKIDVEGHEEAVLRGGELLLRRHRPTVFLSTHEWIRCGVHRVCCHLLTQWGYRLEAIGGGDVESASELLCLAAE